MTLPIPVIDDRQFSDLMAEAVSLIPRYNKDWTNFNPSDPGIALLEIFSWISESIIYRSDRITESLYWKYLSLIGENRKRETCFLSEFQAGDLLVSGGEIRLIAAVNSNQDMILKNALERDLDQPAEISGCKPENCPQPVTVDGKIIHMIEPTFLTKLSEGDIIIADGKEMGVIQRTGDSSIEMHLPFSSAVSGEQTHIAAVYTRIPAPPSDGPPQGESGNKVRVRGRHVLGDGTDFENLQKDNILIVGPWIRVISDIRSKNEATVQIPFDEDIDDAVPYYAILPTEEETPVLAPRSGTVLTCGTRVIGNIENEPLKAARQRAVTYVADPYRTVTILDYEHFAAQALGELAGPDDAFRVICFNNRNFEWTAIGTQRPGHITIFLIVHCADRYLYSLERNKKVFEGASPETIEAITSGVDQGLQTSFSKAFQKGVENALQPSDDENQEALYKQIAQEILKERIIHQVESTLDPKRILTTRVHAVFPRFKPVKVTATLILNRGVNEEQMQIEAELKLNRFIDPIDGGPKSMGYPLGRYLYRSELYQVLEGITGVDHVHELKLDGDDTKRYVPLAEDQFFDPICSVTIERT